MLKIFHFRTLFRMNNIFEDQRMQIKMVPDLLNNLNLVDTINVNPGYCGFISEREAFIDCFCNLFFKMFSIVVYNGYFCFFYLLFPNMDESPRRKAYLLCSFFEKPGHCFSPNNII